MCIQTRRLSVQCTRSLHLIIKRQHTSVSRARTTFGKFWKISEEGGGEGGFSYTARMHQLCSAPPLTSPQEEGTANLASRGLFIFFYINQRGRENMVAYADSRDSRSKRFLPRGVRAGAGCCPLKSPRVFDECSQPSFYSYQVRLFLAISFFSFSFFCRAIARSMEMRG